MKPVALITGGTRGIGFGIARTLAGAGWDLALCGVRAPGEVADALQALRRLGAEIFYGRADVGQAEDRRRLLDAIRAQFGRLNALVNNAGIAPAIRSDLLDATEESFERLMRVNLQGPYFLTQSAAKWMIEQRKADSSFPACVVNISSISAETASPNRGDYCITKAGIGMATKLWAVRLAEYGIPVYEVRPGIIETDMTAAVKAHYDKRIGEGLLLQPRWGTPDDVGRAVAALLRGDLAYSTGQVLRVDGGFSVARL